MQQEHVGREITCQSRGAAVVATESALAAWYADHTCSGVTCAVAHATAATLDG